MKSKMFGVVTFIIIILACLAGLGNNGAQAASIQFSEMKITSNPSNQHNPDISEFGPYNFTIVYQDNRNGNWDIYAYAPGLNIWDPEVRITTDPGNQVNPKIYKDIIVWQDDRNGNWDIYMYNLTSKVETQITTDPASQEQPSIDENVVWQDHRNGHWGIYLYDFTTLTEKVVYVDQYSFIDSYAPSISGNLIVWIGEHINGYYIQDYWVKCMDLSTGSIQHLAFSSSGGPYPLANPQISGNRVVWLEKNLYGAHDWYVHMLDLASENEYSTRNENYPSLDLEEVNCDINREYIVYERYNIGDPHRLYLYNAISGVESNVPSGSGSMLEPAISTEYGNYIVYMDNSDGNWDICLSTFGYVMAGATAPNSTSASSVSSGNTVNSSNKDLMITTIIVVVVIAAILAAVFAVTKRREPKKQELLRMPQNP